MTTLKKTIFLLMAGWVLTLSGCDEDKFFELERPNQYPWQSPAELEMAVRAPYLYFVGAAWHSSSISDPSSSLNR